MQDFTTERAKELVSRGFFFNRAYYFQRALNLIKPHWQILMAYTGLYLTLMFVLLMTPSIGQIVQMVISGPISAGYYISIKRIIDNKHLSFPNFFEGFQNFLPTMLVFMVINLITTLGLAISFALSLPMAIFYVPVLLISTIYLFAMPLLVFGKIGFWNAMESSRIIIMSKYLESLIFVAIIIGVNILGLLALGLGVLFTIPLSYALVLVAYEDIYGFNDLQEETKNYDNDFSHFR